MSKGNNDSNLFPTHPNSKDEDSLFPTRPNPGGALFHNHRAPNENLFSVAELTQEELERIEKFANKRGLSPFNKTRLIAQCRDVAATHKKPKNKNPDSLW